MIEIVGTPIPKDPFYHQRREKQMRGNYESQLMAVHALVAQKEETIQDLLHQLVMKDEKIEELKTKLKRQQSRVASLKTKLGDGNEPSS